MLGFTKIALSVALLCASADAFRVGGVRARHGLRARTMMKDDSSAAAAAEQRATIKLQATEGLRGGAVPMERSYIMIKPDGVQRGLVGEIIKRFEQKGFKLVALKMMQATEELLSEHYCDLVDRPFFPSLCEYMTSGPVVAMVWEGKDVVSTGRKMLGATNPSESSPGTIRGDFAIEVGRNVCHGSDSVDSANREIGLWFGENDLAGYSSCQMDWVYEQ